MLFLLAYGRRYFDGFVDQFSRERRERIANVGHDAATRGRRYLLVAVGQSIVNGFVVGVHVLAARPPGRRSASASSSARSTILPLIGVHRRRHPGAAAGVRA